MCGSLVLMFAASRCECPMFYPGHGRNWDRDFCSMCTPCSASGTTTSGARASPKPGNSPKKWTMDRQMDGWNDKKNLWSSSLGSVHYGRDRAKEGEGYHNGDTGEGGQS